MLTICLSFCVQSQADKMAKQLESQLNEMNAKLEESAHSMQDLDSNKNRMLQESQELQRQLEVSIILLDS